MPRQHWTPAMPGRRAPADPAALSRHGLTACGRPNSRRYVPVRIARPLRPPPCSSGGPARGFVVMGQFPVGQILLHGAAAHGDLDIVPARRNGVSAPCAARPSPGIEKFRIRFDDPVRVHRLGARGTEAIRNPLRRPKYWEIRQAVAIRRETADDNRSDFGAGTQGGCGSRSLNRPSPGMEMARPGVDGDPAGCAAGPRNAARCPREVASLNSNSLRPPHSRPRIATDRWNGQSWV